MQSRTSSKSSLFLIELIIVILFFAVASAICVRLFAQAHLTAQEGRDLNQGVFLAESAAETFRGTDCSPETMETLLGMVPRGNEGYEAYYDENWQPQADRDSAAYLLLLTMEAGSPVATAHVTVLHAENLETPIYELTVKKYTA